MSPLFSWARSRAREVFGKERLRRQATGYDSADYVVLDTELTGLDPRRDAIISIGALRMRGCRIELADAFYRVSKPESPLERGSIVVHGITPEEVACQPDLEVGLKDFYRYCGNTILAGHFIDLDRRFLNRALRRTIGRVLDNPVLDTCSLHLWVRENGGDFSRHYRERTEQLDLYTLARLYGVPVSGAHNALGDAFITAQLLQRLLRMLPAMGVSSLQELLGIGAP